MNAKRQRVDWDAIEPHYRANVRSLRDIAAEFGVSNVAIVKHAEKSGWERDLGAAIKAKADAKLAAALIATERADQPAAKLTEAVRVEVEAEVQARVRHSHRTDINRAKSLVNRYFATLEALEIAEAPSAELAASVKKGATKLPAMSPLKEHIAMLKQLVDGQRALVTMEREAYGIAHLQVDPEDAPTVDPIQGAKAIAFILARAGARLSKEA